MQRLVLVLLMSLVLAACGGETSPSPVAQSTPPTTSSLEGFDPATYTGWGDKYNCGDFKSQQQAQLVLRADPSDPNRLDGGGSRRDGVACQSRPAPRDSTPVPIP